MTLQQPQVIHVWPEDDKPNLICKNVFQVPPWLVRELRLNEDVDLTPEEVGMIGIWHDILGA